MKNPRHTTLCASAAIAAALVLTPSAGLAQAAPTPQITVPDIGAAPAPAPVPAPSSAPVMTSSPVVQPVPTPDPVAAEEEAAPPPAAARTTTTTTRQAAAPRNEAPAPTPVAAPDPAPAAEAAPEPVTATTTPDVAPVVAPPAPVETAPVANDNGWDGALLPVILGGLAVFALAIWGFVAIGRRKPVTRRAAVLERPIPERAPAAATALAEPVVPEPAIVEPARDRVQPIGQPRVTPAASLAHTGASVPLPREMPKTFEERDALIKRMVEAKPDRANPFTGRKARLRRARLILQSLGRDFGDTEPFIDLSQYPQNWPELAGQKHAAA